ncbi:30S ribosomal protein S8e [Nanoarchaeota archaeon]
MAIFKGKAKTKRAGTGARYIDSRKKKVIDLGRLPAMTGIAVKRLKKIIGRGSTKKSRLLSADTVNLFDPKSKKYQKAKIEAVADSAANKHYVRRNIITKGTIIQTDKGKAKVTSRPGQDGVVNAILV